MVGDCEQGEGTVGCECGGGRGWCGHVSVKWGACTA